MSRGCALDHKPPIVPWLRRLTMSEESMLNEREFDRRTMLISASEMDHV
jgi:hypothetical protein